MAAANFQEHHYALMEQLKPIVKDADFDEVFAKLARDENSRMRYLLKAELQRLATPVQRTLDLRDIVSHDCQRFEHAGRNHYLDQHALAIFKHGLKTYSQVFTEDTYGQIQAYLDGEHPLAVPFAEDVVEHIDVPLLPLGGYAKRDEERMNFVVEAQLGHRHSDTPEINVLTTDISVNGLRVKCIEKPEFVSISADVYVRHTGLSQQFTLDQNKRIPYVVVKLQTELDQETQTETVYISLRRAEDFADAEFDKFLLGFINGYKKRYKLNLEHALQAAEVKGHEQSYLPRIEYLPLYFRHDQQRMFADLALLTDNNRSLSSHWRDELNHVVIGGLFSGKRLSNLLKRQQQDDVVHDVIYSFSVTVKGKIYFYSATATELKATGLASVFFYIGQQKDSWRVYQVDFTELDSSKLWPHDDLKPPSDKVMARLQRLSHVACIHDVTAFATPQVHEQVLKRSHIQAMRQFIHPQRLSYKTQLVDLEFANLRRESRFSYRTPIKLGWQGRHYNGVTVDFSTQGLQVDIDEAIHTELGMQVAIDLPELNRHRQQKNLVNMPYEIVGHSADGTTLHLRVIETSKSHPAALFFSELIERNREQLSEQREKSQHYGIELCLRNLLCGVLMQFPLFIYKTANHSSHMGRIGVSQRTPSWLQFAQAVSAKGGHVDLSLFAEGQEWLEHVLKPLRSLSRESTPDPILLALRLPKMLGQRDTANLWLTVAEHQHGHITSELKDFLANAQQNNLNVVVVKLALNRVGRPDLEFIASELNYLAGYAKHKAASIESELWDLNSVVDISDVTSTVLSELELLGN